MPAHWGGMAQFIERFGFPKVMAGGSSATITAFWMESIRENPILKHVQTSNPQLAHVMGSLLWKSLETLPSIVANHLLNLSAKDSFLNKSNRHKDVIRALLLSLGSISQIQQTLEAASQISAPTSKVWTKTNNIHLLQIIDTYESLPGALLFFGPAAQRVKLDALTYQIELSKLDTTHPDWENADLNAALKNLAVSGKQLSESIDMLGKFDAIHDHNIFFREGLANFEYLPVLAGLIGDYLSQNGADSNSLAKMMLFLNTCAPRSRGATWSQINQSTANSCIRLANDAWNGFLASKKMRIPNALTPSIDRVVGERQPVLISTAVILGSTAERIADEYNRIYGSPLKLINEGNFFPLPTSDLRFGYWGSQKALGDVEDSLNKKALPLKNRITDPKLLDRMFYNDKTLRFLGLPAATWRTAISLSPAEPGLAPITPFPKNSFPSATFSAGGWSDLHPTIMLSMLPECEKVAYLTRRGEDSAFALSIRSRLLGKETEPIPTLETAVDFEGKSILQISLEAADHVICTDWNKLSVGKQFHKLIENSYRAKIISKESKTSAPGCTP